jgi:hypothetical protein
MRKSLIAALTALAVLAVAGVAYAANVYDLPNAGTSPAGKGSPSKPLPKSVNFDYTVKDSAGPRGAPVKKYKIAFQGITSKYAKKFKRCKFSDVSPNAPLSTIQAKCKKAKVGEGRVENLVTSDAMAGDPNSVLTYCNLKLTLYNVVGGLAIRLDGDPPPPSSQNGPLQCVVPTHSAIKAKLKNLRIGGVPSASIEFTVPIELRHNSGLSITVARVQSTVFKKTKRVKIRGKRRKVGFFSAIGCGRKRQVRVTFVDENGASAVAKKSGRC